MPKTNYSINLIWSDEDQGFVATVPEFKNLSAFGATREEALNEAQSAIDAYLETLEEDGISAPQADKFSNYSGQIRLRMPRQLHRTLANAAASDGVSLNTYMVHLLSLTYGTIRQAELEGNYVVYSSADQQSSAMSKRISLGPISLGRGFTQEIPFQKESTL
jgi:antitoxin HicB